MKRAIMIRFEAAWVSHKAARQKQSVGPADGGNKRSKCIWKVERMWRERKKIGWKGVGSVRGSAYSVPDVPVWVVTLQTHNLPGDNWLESKKYRRPALEARGRWDGVVIGWARWNSREWVNEWGRVGWDGGSTGRGESEIEKYWEGSGQDGDVLGGVGVRWRNTGRGEVQMIEMVGEREKLSGVGLQHGTGMGEVTMINNPHRPSLSWQRFRIISRAEFTSHFTLEWLMIHTDVNTHPFGHAQSL